MSKISFCASGTITQEIEIVNPEISLREIVDGLNSGKYMTTLHDSKTIEVVLTGEVVANIIQNDNQLEYSDFDID